MLGLRIFGSVPAIPGGIQMRLYRIFQFASDRLARGSDGQHERASGGKHAPRPSGVHDGDSDRDHAFGGSFRGIQHALHAVEIAV